MSSEHLDSLGNWVSVVIVYEETVIVSEELTAENSVVVTSNAWIQIGYIETTSS